MTRSSGILLAVAGVLAGALLGILGTLGVQHLGHDEPTTYLEQLPGYKAANDQAALYCTLGGVVPGMRGLRDPAYLQCVEDETRSNLEQAGVPEARTAPSRLG